MTFKHHTCDPRSERLLLVTLHDADHPGSEYRHISATVIRRAVPHRMQAEAPLSVAEYNDDYAEKCSGYRNASYTFGGRTPTYIDDMKLHGQIDTGPRPLREGKPYGNEIRFSPYVVKANSAFQILDFFKKLEKYKAKHELGTHEESFYDALRHLADMLKITTVVFYKPGVRHCGLNETNCFEEYDIAGAEGRLDALLAQFYQPTKE